MLKSLYWKLTLAFALVAIATALLIAVFIRITSPDRLYQFILDQQRSTMVQAVSSYYVANGSWDGINEIWGSLQRYSYNPTPLRDNLPFNEGRQERDRRDLFGLADVNNRVIVATDLNYPPGSRLPAAIIRNGTAVTVNGQRVGTIFTPSRAPGFDPAEALFLTRTYQGLAIATVGALIVAALVGALLARTLTRPVRALTTAAQNMAEGNLDQQVQVSSTDEIGQLAAAFNRMSQQVARANHQRRQMTADIAHDLRTPLTVIAGYVESMRDGVLQPTEQRLALIYTEIERLQHLVGDLRMLSQADAGELSLNPQTISPEALLQHAAELFEHHASQQSIHLQVEFAPGLPDIDVDEARMMQVLDNLISNALRYTPPGGQITLSAALKDGKIEIKVTDTGTGIAEDELEHVFERFHRADKSRHAEGSESGLGLAIVKALVEAQKGRVWALSQTGQGTTIHMQFPPARNG